MAYGAGGLMGLTVNATTLLVKSAPQWLGAAAHAIPSYKPVPD